jgi:hypothetical protein
MFVPVMTNEPRARGFTMTGSISVLTKWLQRFIETWWFATSTLDFVKVDHHDVAVDA